MQSKYVALIPAYQPTEILLGLVRKLAAGFSVVLVDDGSGKAYESLFARCAAYARVLRHEANKGKGRALKTGLAYIRQNYGPDAVVVTLDADGQHRAADAALCRSAGQHPGVLFLGSRRMKGKVPLRSRFGNRVTRFVYRLSTGVSVYDTQTGLRAFGVCLIPLLLSVPGERYEYEMNVLLRCARDKIEIREQEIETIYIDNNAASHFDTLRDSARIYKEICKFSASSFLCFLLDYGLYSLLLLTGSLPLANIGARVVSAGVNFAINRRFVFKKKEGAGRAAVQYFLLAAGILAGNTAVLALLVDWCGLHRLPAKIFTEILFFIFSWLVQRWVIFRKRGAC